MKKNIIPLIIICITALSVYAAITSKEWEKALSLQWFGFAVLLSFVLFRQYKEHKRLIESTGQGKENEMWVSPLSRKVEWARNVEGGVIHGNEIGTWQSHKIYSDWLAGGKKWQWVRNTNLNEWPPSIVLEDGMRWWNGVAIYKEVMDK